MFLLFYKQIPFEQQQQQQKNVCLKVALTNLESGSTIGNIYFSTAFQLSGKQC